MVRNRAALRKGLIKLYGRVCGLETEEAKAAVEKVKAILMRAKSVSPKVEGIGDLKGPELIPLLDEVGEILEPFKGVSAGKSNPGGSAGKSRGTPKSRIPKKLQELFDSVTEKGLVSGSLADFIGNRGDMETALNELRVILAKWQAEQKAAHLKVAAKVIEGDKATNLDSGKEETEGDSLSMEEIEDLRLKPCRHCGDPFVRGHQCFGTKEVVHHEGFDDEGGLRKKRRRTPKADDGSPAGEEPESEMETVEAEPTVEEISGAALQKMVDEFCERAVVLMAYLEEQASPVLPEIRAFFRQFTPVGREAAGADDAELFKLLRKGLEGDVERLKEVGSLEEANAEINQHLQATEQKRPAKAVATMFAMARRLEHAGRAAPVVQQNNLCQCLFCDCTNERNLGHHLCDPCHGEHREKHDELFAAEQGRQREAEETGVGSCERPISELYGGVCGGGIVTVTAKSDSWITAWLRRIFRAEEWHMCTNCAEALDAFLSGDPKEVRQRLAELAKKVGRPLPGCAYRVAEDCEPDAAPGIFYVGRNNKYPEVPLFLNKEDRERGEGNCCAPCHTLMLSLVKDYDGDGQDGFRKLLLDKRGIKVIQPALRAVEEDAAEKLVCADCGVKLCLATVCTDGEEQLCNICSLIRVAGRKGVAPGKIRHAKGLRAKDPTKALEYLIKILSEASKFRGSTAGAKAVAEERKPCLDPFHCGDCTGFVSSGEKNLCPACREFANSVEWYDGPGHWLEMETYYYFRCSADGCDDAHHLTGQQLRNLGFPSPDKLLCEACYAKKVETEMAEAPDCPTYKGYEGCQGKRNLKKRNENGSSEYYPLCAACHARKKQEEAEARAVEAAESNPVLVTDPSPLQPLPLAA